LFGAAFDEASKETFCFPSYAVKFTLVERVETFGVQMRQISACRIGHWLVVDNFCCEWTPVWTNVVNVLFGSPLLDEISCVVENSWADGNLRLNEEDLFGVESFDSVSYYWFLEYVGSWKWDGQQGHQDLGR
jgi:hypothetical protein